MAPAGIGNEVSRRTCKSAKVRPPPAESPDIKICAGLTGVWGAPSGGRIKYKSR